MKVQVCIKVDRDGDLFHAYSPDLPGLHVCGETEEEALATSIDAVGAYLRSMVKHGEPLPIACGVRDSLRHEYHMTQVELALA